MMREEVWLKFEDPEDEEAELEAFVYERGFIIFVDWWHSAVGKVTRRSYPNRYDAHKWLLSEGFENYTA